MWNGSVALEDIEKAMAENFCDIRDFCENKEKEQSVCGEPRVLIYRFPNLFGKWCRPNYNSAVATFCNAFANDLPYTVNDPSVELELLYIDDLVDEMIAGLQGKEHHCEFNGHDVLPQAEGRCCYVPTTHKVTFRRNSRVVKAVRRAASDVDGSRDTSRVVRQETIQHLSQLSIINLSDTEDLVTVKYCNEVFNPHRPDTFFLEV